MGPQGMRDLGQACLQRSRYLARRLSTIPGVRAPAFESVAFKEFVVDFNETGRSVAEVNAALLERGIFGGVDLSGYFPELGQAALYAVSEVHTKDDLDRLVSAVAEIVA